MSSLVGYSAAYARRTLRSMRRTQAKHIKQMARAVEDGVLTKADFRFLALLVDEIETLEKELGERE